MHMSRKAGGGERECIDQSGSTHYTDDDERKEDTITVQLTSMMRQKSKLRLFQEARKRNSNFEETSDTPASLLGNDIAEPPLFAAHVTKTGFTRAIIRRTSRPFQLD
jgi:hypothetical protein